MATTMFVQNRRLINYIFHDVIIAHQKKNYDRKLCLLARMLENYEYKFVCKTSCRSLELITSY